MIRKLHMGFNSITLHPANNVPAKIYSLPSPPPQTKAFENHFYGVEMENPFRPGFFVSFKNSLASVIRRPSQSRGVVRPRKSGKSLHERRHRLHRRASANIVARQKKGRRHHRRGQPFALFINSKIIVSSAS